MQKKTCAVLKDLSLDSRIWQTSLPRVHGKTAKKPVRTSFVKKKSTKIYDQFIIPLPISLLHGWNEKTPQPYGDHKDFNLFYFEYSDHSSYSDLVSFVKVVKPKKVIPLIESTKETGILAKRTSFLNQVCMDLDK